MQKPESPERQTAVVAEPTRLDQFLVNAWPVLDRERVRQMVGGNAVLVNGVPARKAGQRVRAGDEVTATVPDVAASQPDFLVPPLPLSVLYEDQFILVVDKRAGMLVHPGKKASHDTAVVQTVAQQLVGLDPDLAHIGGVGRAGIVMRLEPEASGALLAAKDEETYRAMQRLVKRKRVESAYSVLVDGRLTGEYLIDQPIGNVKRARQRLAVAREGRPAQTHYRGQRHYKDQGHDYSLLEVRPKTSRLHQIRVHLSWYGFPLVGDRVYGSRRQPLLPDRIFLHLSVLTFPHPVTGETIRAESALPPELRSILRYLARPKGR